MKGFPLRDVFLILLAALLVGLPLHLLTRPAVTLPPPAVPASSGSTPETRVEAWLDLRFSHAPVQVRIFQKGELLFEGGGALREEADLLITLSEARKGLDLEFRWPENVEQAYVEMTLEAGDLPPRRLGFWGSGELKRQWMISWEEAP